MTYTDALITVIGVIIATVFLAVIVVLSIADREFRLIILVALSVFAAAAIVAFPLAILT
jgi:hypothetical protein